MNIDFEKLNDWFKHTMGIMGEDVYNVGLDRQGKQRIIKLYNKDGQIQDGNNLGEDITDEDEVFLHSWVKIKNHELGATTNHPPISFDELLDKCDS